MRRSQTIGLAWASPGMDCCQRTFLPASTSHVSGVAEESLTPPACGPRNCGQFAAVAPSTPAQFSRRRTQTVDSRRSRLGFMQDRSLRLRETVGDIDHVALGAVKTELRELAVLFG